MTFEEYFGDWVHIFDMKELNKVLTVLNKMYKIKPICPKQEDVFRAFNLCKYDDCKVIFIGYDPYPQKGVATGILFGNSADTNEKDWSPSLKIVRDAVIDLHRPHNLIIQLATTSGLPGCILYIIAIGLILARAFKRLNNSNRIYTIVFFAIIAYLISAMFGNSMYYTSPYYFIFLGITFSITIRHSGV